MKYSPVGSRCMCGYSGRAAQAWYGGGPHTAGGVSQSMGSVIVDWSFSASVWRGQISYVPPCGMPTLHRHRQRAGA